MNLSKVPASFAHLERQGRLLPDGRRGGELLQLCNLMLSFSIKVKDTWKLRVHKCWNLQLSQRQLHDIQFIRKATTIRLPGLFYWRKGGIGTV